MFRVGSKFGSARSHLLKREGEAGAGGALLLLWLTEQQSRAAAGQSPSHDGATRLCCELVIVRESEQQY